METVITLEERAFLRGRSYSCNTGMIAIRRRNYMFFGLENPAENKDTVVVTKRILSLLGRMTARDPDFTFHISSFVEPRNVIELPAVNRWTGGPDCNVRAYYKPDFTDDIQLLEQNQESGEWVNGRLIKTMNDPFAHAKGGFVTPGFKDEITTVRTLPPGQNLGILVQSLTDFDFIGISAVFHLGTQYD